MNETLFAAFTENPRSLTHLRRGYGAYVMASCQVKEVLELSDTDFTALTDDFRADYTFIRDHVAAISAAQDDCMNCLLITTAARNQGILMSQFRGKRYIKHIADLPKLGLDLAEVPICREALVKLAQQPKKSKRMSKNQER